MCIILQEVDFHLIKNINANIRKNLSIPLNLINYGSVKSYDIKSGKLYFLKLNRKLGKSLLEFIMEGNKRSFGSVSCI